MQKRLICMMGLPRSGKSTMAAHLREKGVPIVNQDSIRLALHGRRFIALAEPMVHAIAEIMARSLIIAGHATVCVDETNVRRSVRDKWKSPDWETLFWEIATSKQTCLDRARAVDDFEIQPVIERMSAEYEPLGPDEKRFMLDSLCGY